MAVSLVADLLHYLAQRGCDIDALLREAGIVRADLADPEGRIPSERKARLNAAAIRATGDPDLGLHMAESVRAGSLGLLSFVLMTSEDVAELLTLGARYFGLLMAGGRYAVHREANAFVLSFEQEPGILCPQFDEPRYIVESALLSAVRQVDFMTARVVPPRLVTFRHPEPATGSAEHRRCFGAPIVFNAPANAVHYSASSGSIPVRGAHAQLNATFRQQADALHALLQQSGGVAERARRVVAVHFRGAIPRVQIVAAELGMSARSLQRALAAEQVTFSSLVDDVRRELAVGLLRQRGTRVTEVAFLLGFQESSSFTRAVRRWTGRPPSALRESGATSQ